MKHSILAPVNYFAVDAYDCAAYGAGSYNGTDTCTVSTSPSPAKTNTSTKSSTSPSAATDVSSSPTESAAPTSSPSTSPSETASPSVVATMSPTLNEADVSPAGVVLGLWWLWLPVALFVLAGIIMLLARRRKKSDQGSIFPPSQL